MNWSEPWPFDLHNGNSYIGHVGKNIKRASLYSNMLLIHGELNQNWLRSGPVLATIACLHMGMPCGEMPTINWYTEQWRTLVPEAGIPGRDK